MLKKMIINSIFIIILAVLPAIILFNAYSPKSGFLDLIFFGEQFSANRLKEINSINLPAQTQIGYDGQFYAQVALDPLILHDNTIHALYEPTSRARRIGLPILSFILGFGNPAWILQIYALLNFAFWGLLLLALYRYSGFCYRKDFLLAASVLWSTGTLVSLSRALTDFPAATLSVLAVFLIAKRKIAASLLSFATLCKETSGLGFLLLAWPEGKWKTNLHKIFISCLIVFIPIAVWVLYIRIRINNGFLADNNNFAFPFLGIICKVTTEGERFFRGLSQFSIIHMRNLLYEFVCPLSLLAQSVYLIVKPRLYSPFWKLGIGFAAVIYIVGNAVWVEQVSYCRSLLILTFCFNFLIHRYERGISYALWYFIGNVGMSWMCVKLLSKWVLNTSF